MGLRPSGGHPPRCRGGAHAWMGGLRRVQWRIGHAAGLPLCLEILREAIAIPTALRCLAFQRPWKTRSFLVPTRLAPETA